MEIKTCRAQASGCWLHFFFIDKYVGRLFRPLTFGFVHVLSNKALCSCFLVISTFLTILFPLASSPCIWRPLPIQTRLVTSLPKQEWRGHDLYQWNGFWFRLQYLQGTQEVLNHFKPLPTDVILASFPKTGTTWLKSLLYSVINRGANTREQCSLKTSHPHLLVPTLEIQLYGAQPQSFSSFPGSAVHSSNRIFATHIPFQLFAKVTSQSDCRVVYVTRNPKDTVTSLWQFVLKLKKEEEPWSLEMAVEKFCNGTTPFGPYYDHVLGYRKESLQRPEKVFFITYEELKNDPITNVKRLAEFLGCPFASKEEMEEILRSCSHEVNKSDNDLLPWLKMPLSSFFRQGKVGDNANYLNSEMIDCIDKIT